MSGRRLKKAQENKTAETTAIVAPPVVVPTVSQTMITATGILFDGKKVSQDFLIKYAQEKLGEAFWGAIEIVKRIGGLVEEDESGLTWYPTEVFDGGVRFTVKKSLNVDATKL